MFRGRERKIISNQRIGSAASSTRQDSKCRPIHSVNVNGTAAINTPMAAVSSKASRYCQWLYGYRRGFCQPLFSAWLMWRMALGLGRFSRTSCRAQIQIFSAETNRILRSLFNTTLVSRALQLERSFATIEWYRISKMPSKG